MKKAKYVSVKIPQYWIDTSKERYVFEAFVIFYKTIGLKVKFEEIWHDGTEMIAVFWIGKKPIKYINVLKEKYENA